MNSTERSFSQKSICKGRSKSPSRLQESGNRILMNSSGIGVRKCKKFISKFRACGVIAHKMGLNHVNSMTTRHFNLRCKGKRE